MTEFDNQGWMGRIRRMLSPDASDSLATRIRARRWNDLLDRFPDFEQMRVIDLGGTTGYWTRTPVRPKEVLVVNIDEGCVEDSQDEISTLRADVCSLPSRLFDEPFDLVYSNSLIEHVGGHSRRLAMAEAVYRLADHHWIQTPYRYFPIEPHWVFPVFQSLPVSFRAEISRRWPLSQPPELRSHTHDEAIDDVLSVELLSLTEMRRLFPRSEMYRERFAGLTKSLVAVR